jgi:hypothetical protein
LKKKIYKQSLTDNKELASKKIKYYVESAFFKKYLAVIKHNHNLISQISEVDNDLILLNEKVNCYKKKIMHCINIICNKKEPEMIFKTEL